MTVKTRFCGEAKNRSSINEFSQKTQVTIAGDNQTAIVNAGFKYNNRSV